MTLSFASLVRLAGRPALLGAAAAMASFLPWTWSLLTQSAVRHAVIRQTSSVACFLRLTRLMKVAIFAAAFIVPFILAHGPRVFGFSIHSGIYLLPVNQWDGCPMDRVAVARREVPQEPYPRCGRDSSFSLLGHPMVSRKAAVF